MAVSNDIIPNYFKKNVYSSDSYNYCGQFFNDGYKFYSASKNSLTIFDTTDPLCFKKIDQINSIVNNGQAILDVDLDNED